MIIGFTLYGQDNDSFFFNNDQHTGTLCESCGFIKDFNSYFNPFFKLKRKNFDFSHPYDIGEIVSLKFKEFCQREQYKGLVFKEFEWEPNFYQFIVNNIVEFDIERRMTELLDFCPACGNYREVVGSLPTFLKGINRELADGFYRTDVIFGEGNRKHPLIIVGSTTTTKLKKEKMKGLILEPITQ